ncbi:MAG: hypothetical protein R3314_02825 [Longimicrobiales bacterium]|nr:hypothetical protein [Longimicrobiales bacterium]
MSAHTESTRTVTREAGLTGRLVVGGTVSTGLLLGGYTVGAMALAGRMNGNALLVTSFGLFLVGAAIGLVVALLIGLPGREHGWSLRDAVRSAGTGVLYAIPAALIGSVLAGWIAMAVIGVYAGKTVAVALSVAAAVVGLGILAATFRTTWTCGVNVARRVRAAF